MSEKKSFCVIDPAVSGDKEKRESKQTKLETVFSLSRSFAFLRWGIKHLRLCVDARHYDPEAPCRCGLKDTPENRSNFEMDVENIIGKKQ